MYGAYVSTPNVVHLGNEVTCDGCPPSAAAAVRVQTHIHLDHMTDWQKSLTRNVYMSEFTKKLICGEDSRSSEIYRHNLIEQPVDGEYFGINGCESRIRLYNSGHMLGSCMVSVKCFQTSYIYTSDFGWPLPDADQLKLQRASHHVLIIDASYGHPVKSKRFYSQDSVNNALIEIVSKELNNKSVRIIGTRGRLQRAYQIIASNLDKQDIIFTGSPNVNKTIDIYHDGYGMSSETYFHKTNEKRIIHLVDARDHSVIEAQRTDECVIRLSETRSQEQYVAKTSRGYQLSMTDHADFGGTIALINLIQPKGGILTVGTHAYELANYAKNEMGYEACCAIMKQAVA